MGKIFLVCLLFYSTLSISQIRFDESYYNIILNNSSKEKNINFKSSYSVYFTSGFFIPVRLFHEESNGIDYNFGIQKNVSETMSWCFDIDLAYTEKTYLQFEVSPRFYFPAVGKLKLFVGPKFGTLLSTAVDKVGLSFQSFFPLCFSLEAGFQYNVNKNLSVLFKFNDNSRLRVWFYNSDLDNYIFINGGIGYQF
jgi:hypothetical protein